MPLFTCCSPQEKRGRCSWDSTPRNQPWRPTSVSTHLLTEYLAKPANPTAYWHFLLTFSVLNGLGCALLLTPSLAAVGHWFYVRRGLATGLAATGGSIGGIVYPLMLRSLLPKVGWASSLRIHALVSCLCCMAGNLLVRSRVAPAHDATSRPDLRILKQRAFALVVVATFLLELAMFVPLTYLSSYAVAEGGFSTDFAFALLPVLNAGSVLGRALPGWWADRIGPFQANITATALSGVVCLAVWLPAGRTTAGIVVFAVLFGFASGSNISLTPVCIGRLCRTQHYGRYYATCYVVVSIACLIGIPVAGSIIEACGGRYWGLILFTGLSYCVSVATLWGAMYCL